jgi:uncharacterized UPF0160 family protein
MSYLKNSMINQNETIKLVTHDGSFHADDIFACAVLCLLLEKKGEKFGITRTRDKDKIEAGDYVFDVGGIYDEDKKRFDHHQKGGAGQRSGIEYSSLGLVWKKFGIELCGSEKILNIVENRLVAPVDAFDNGLDLVENKYDVSPFFIDHFFLTMVPTWREDYLSKDEMFLKSVEIAKVMLSREIIQAQDSVLGEEKVISIYEKTKDKRIIVLDKDYSYEYILNKFPEPLWVVYPRTSDDSWGVRAIREDPKTFKNRKDFPRNWGGLRDEELQKVSGVADAIFCHRGLFMGVARTKEGAIKLAKLAL